MNLFLYDIKLPHAVKSRCPSRADFVARVFPQLEELEATVLREVAAGMKRSNYYVINYYYFYTPTGRTSCKSTELKHCSMIKMHWNKYEVSLASPV